MDINLGPLNIRGWCDLPLPWHSYNWVTVDLIRAHFEADYMLGGVEVGVALLGFHLELRWTYDRKTETWEKLDTQMAELKSGELEIVISLKEYEELRRKAESAEQPENYGGTD
jgi:hypothetical protein